MGVETIGEALTLGWRVVARCVRGREDDRRVMLAIMLHGDGVLLDLALMTTARCAMSPLKSCRAWARSTDGRSNKKSCLHRFRFTFYLDALSNFLICAFDFGCSPIAFESCNPIRSDARRNGSASRYAYAQYWSHKCAGHISVATKPVQTFGFLERLIFLKLPKGCFLGGLESAVNASFVQILPVRRFCPCRALRSLGSINGNEERSLRPRSTRHRIAIERLAPISGWAFIQASSSLSSS